MDHGFEDALKLANRKHDLVALQITDPGEDQLPNVGLIRLQDPETGASRLIDTSDADIREKFRRDKMLFKKELKEMLAVAGVDSTELLTNKSYVKPLMQLFKKRGKK